MIYLDNSATSFRKPAAVSEAVIKAMHRCANPGRGGYPASMEATKTVYACRELASEMFDCLPEQVVFTSNCTHGLNIAINTLVRPGMTVAVSGFEHNAVTRPLNMLRAKMIVAGRKLFDWEDTLVSFEQALRNGAQVAIFTHVSNVFGYILPVEEMSALCRQYRVPFIIDAAQSAGAQPVRLGQLGADFIAMPGHKGLLGPQGTGLLLCANTAKPLIYGGTGSDSIRQQMPDYLPDALEAGTLNVPGIAGLHAGLKYLKRIGTETVFIREQKEADRCARQLQQLGVRVFSGEHQAGVVSFVPHIDCEELAQGFAEHGIAVRAGLHCAPLAHESAGTLESGTVRVSFGHEASQSQTNCLIKTARFLLGS